MSLLCTQIVGSLKSSYNVMALNSPGCLSTAAAAAPPCYRGSNISRLRQYPSRRWCGGPEAQPLTGVASTFLGGGGGAAVRRYSGLEASFNRCHQCPSRRRYSGGLEAELAMSLPLAAVLQWPSCLAAQKVLPLPLAAVLWLTMLT
ncbi:hypothetical protein N7488_010404 [Penicillium malachiteum]|nr:hypothetical protein N7488_010404 [Penicillium malachiteum]